MCISVPLSECLGNIQKTLNLKLKCPNGQNFHAQIQQMKQDLFNCSNDYYGGVDRNVLLAKIRIDEALERLRNSSEGDMVSPGERNIIKNLQNRLNCLNSEADQLLKEGILTLYMDLCDLREKAALVKSSKKIESLIKSVIEIITSLLKLFFIFQEYHNCKNSQSNKKKSILSLRNLNHSANQHLNQKSELDEQLMREIEESLSSKPVAELLEAYMNKEAREINERLEVCRICSSKIKLENMEKHVKGCQKKCLLKQQIEERNARITSLLEQLREEYQSVNEKQERTCEEESFRRVAKLLLCSEKKKERNTRRSSLVGVKSEKSFKDKFEQYIEEYEYENGEHDLLHKILENCREKGYLEKRVNAIEIITLNSDQNESESFADKCCKSDEAEDQEGKGSAEAKKFKLPKYTSFEDESILSAKSSFALNEENNGLSKSSNLFSTHFREMCSTTKRSLRKNSHEIEYDDLYKHYVSLQDIAFQEEEKLSISLENFEILKFLGQGAFGKVYLVRRIETGDVYALKIIKINESYEEKELEVIKNEHEIFKKIAGDHLVKAPFSFSEKESHMFVLEYLPGGDLRKMLDDEVYFEEDKAQFYIAEIVLAIDHLHKFQIIHRDLKPENLVIDKDGHLKLTDFGLSEFQIKIKLEKSKQFCEQAKDIKRRRARRTGGFWGNRKNVKLIGTPDYIAPEIISHISIKNYTIDWWSLGVMTYEMLIGARPFSAETIEEVIENITSYKIEWPEIGYEEGMISPEAKDLISQLLNTDFTSRLGANGVEEVKSHPFFKGIDWDNLKNSRPPMIPKMSSISQLQEMKEDKDLREEVYKLVGSSNKLNKRLNLERFVRFDLLGDETIENVEKLYEQQNSRIQKLKTIRKLQLQTTELSEGQDAESL